MRAVRRGWCREAEKLSAIPVRRVVRYEKRRSNVVVVNCSDGIIARPAL